MNRVILVTLLATLVSAFSEEMLKGVQTGVFITDPQNMKRYACEEVKLPPQAETFINMIHPMEVAFIQFTNKMTGDIDGEVPEKCEDCEANIKRLATIYFLFMGSYDGTDFC